MVKAAFLKGDRLGAAYHEAGHAVVAWSLGLPVGAIAISDDDPTAGTTDVGTTEHLPTTDRLAVCLAGIEAQHLFRFPTNEHAGYSDYVKVLDIIGEDLTEQESLELRNAGYMRARGLILAHESKVALLAERLADDGRMDASEFTKLMNAR